MELPHYARLARALCLAAPLAAAPALSGCTGVAHAEGHVGPTGCPGSLPREGTACVLPAGAHCDYNSMGGEPMECLCNVVPGANPPHHQWSCARRVRTSPGPLPPPELGS